MRIVLIICGGIAAYKSLDLIRKLRNSGMQVRPVLTKAGAQFVTPLSVSTLAEERVFEDLFSLTDENEIGHIEIAKETDIIVVAPATADFIAKISHGICDDLATTLLLATDKPILLAPAMNTRMWQKPITQSNLKKLKENNISVVGPEYGPLAEGEVGLGRMAEPHEIILKIENILRNSLSGKHVIVTSGPTHEPIDPVRFIANRSSGKQGHAIANACALLGAKVTLITGPTAQPDPTGVKILRVETAEEMLNASVGSLPADVAICAAAVSDWRPISEHKEKIKKLNLNQDVLEPTLQLVRNPDILLTIGTRKNDRPSLVIGFAAETENLTSNAKLKLKAKECDWILANNVSHQTETFGGDHNNIHMIYQNKNNEPVIEEWPSYTKVEVGARLATRIADFLASKV